MEGKFVIVNVGCTNQGKSKSIIRVYEKLKNIYDITNQVELGSIDKEIRAIVNAGDFKIGIESFGDPNSRQNESIKYFVEQGCEIMVLAARTSGGTRQNIEDIKSKGYSIFYTANSRCVNNEWHDYVNDLYADSIVKLIQKLTGL